MKAGSLLLEHIKGFLLVDIVLENRSALRQKELKNKETQELYNVI